MRRAAAILTAVLLVVLLAVPCQAANAASRADISVSVNPNGSCLVTTDLQLHLDSAPDSLYFPLPKDSRSISLNGSSARTRRTGDTVEVNLSSLVRGTVGDFSVRIQYTLPNVVDYNEQNQLQLQLPLLSGFLYPINALSLSVNLPGENTLKPAFTSGYYQQSIEAEMDFAFQGNTVTGSLLSPLKDRETLTMLLEVSEEVFPQDPIKQWAVGVDDILMAVLAGLSLLYWLIFLRCAPLLRVRTAAAPEGFSAGQLGSALTGQGADLTLMVFSWAQLGYLLIHTEDNGRVTLHKRMDMGNERSALEVRVFRSLFAKRSVVDGTGLYYANLCRKVAAGKPEIRELYRRSSGNPLGLRVLCAGIGVFSGVSLGTALVGNALLGILLIVLLAAIGGLAAWFMQSWYRGLHQNRKDLLWSGLILATGWSLLGLIAGDGTMALLASLAQLVCGILWAYGGRRTAIGRQTAGEILGLRHYLRTLPKEEAHRLTQADPEFFFDLAPYAMALGVLKPFAKRFGATQLTSCPYLTSGLDGHMSAEEWSSVMEKAAQTLDLRQRRLPLDRLLGR